MTVYIVPNVQKKSAAETVRQAMDVLVRHGAGVVLDAGTAALAPFAPFAGAARKMKSDAACAACDVILTVGGDGTMLHAAAMAMAHGKPLVGVNIGRLGFLTAIESDGLDVLARLAVGDYSVERRSVLQAKAVRDGDVPCAALNDVVLFKENPERTIALEIYCDGILVSRFRGDGIVFATPTGSTAYSMSAGGPIVDARMGGIIVTQICAHIVHTPPMVFAPDRRVRVRAGGARGEETTVICDGKRLYSLPAGGSLEICQSGRTVPLVQFGDAEQLKSIDRKLKGR